MNGCLGTVTALARSGPAGVGESPALAAAFDAGGLEAGGAVGLAAAALALVGLAAGNEPVDDLAELIERVERLADGEAVTFPTDRDDDLGRLSEALEDVAAQLRREDAGLDDRQRQLEAIVENTENPIYIKDSDGVYRFVNEAAADIFGRSPSEVVGLSDDGLLPPDVLDEVEANDRRVIERDEPVSMETEVVVDGQRRVLLDNKYPYRDGDGTVRGVLGIAYDITERKERERELSTLMDNIPGMVYRAKNERGWPFEFVSDGSRELTGYDPETLERGDVSWGEEVIVTGNDELWEAVQAAIERRDPYRVTYRIETADGETRWVWEQGRGVFDGDELAALEGVILDVTEQRERELALESLQETTRDLLGTETVAEVADRVVEHAAEFLDVPCIAIYLLDGETNHLEPAAFSSAFIDLCEDPDPVPIDRGDSLLWDVFVGGERTAVDADAESSLFGPAVDRALVVPLADYGVFVAATTDPAIDEDTRRLVETLAATTEAALDRLESETLLRERESELASRNRRLRRQIQINNIIRSIHTSLIGAESRADIERTVCERLVEAEHVRFAWIGSLDASETELAVRAWDGTGQDYLDELSLDVEEGSEPSLVAARTGEPTVVGNVVEGLGAADWRQRALLREFHSVVSVPLAFDEFSAGVLTVYADEPDAFGDLEEAVFAELGESIASSVAAVNARQALHAETLVELTVGLAGDSFFTRVAQEADCRVEYEGLAAHGGGESRLFFTTVGAEAEAVLAVLDGLVSVTDARLVSEFADERLFEATVAEETIPARLARHGGRLRSVRADGDALELVVDVPRTTDVREFLGMLEEEYASVELLSRRDVERTIQTRQEFLEYLLDELTDRQLEVLRTAYYAGFFEWPRASTGEDIAEMLGVTQPTVNRHLRLGQQRLLEALFEHAVTGRD